MEQRETTDDDTGTSVDETAARPALDPFPAVNRGAERVTTDGERATADRTANDEPTTARQSDEDTGDGDDRGHVCDPDSPVPCQFH